MILHRILPEFPPNGPHTVIALTEDELDRLKSGQVALLDFQIDVPAGSVIIYKAEGQGHAMFRLFALRLQLENQVMGEGGQPSAPPD